MDVVQEARGIIRGTSYGERQHQRDEKNADGVVPIEQFETVILHTFISICPGAPTNRARNHHNQGNAKIMRNEHEIAAPSRAGDSNHCLRSTNVERSAVLPSIALAAYSHGNSGCQGQSWD